MSAIAGRVMPLPKGVWNSTTSYKILDIVQYGNSSWIAKRNNINVPPVDSDDWQLLVSDSRVILTKTLSAGSTVLTFTDSAIGETNSFIEIFTNISGVQYKSIAQSGSSVTITFPAQSSDMEVKLIIKEE